MNVCFIFQQPEISAKFEFTIDLKFKCNKGMISNQCIKIINIKPLSLHIHIKLPYINWVKKCSD